jgi:hypothetical protein
LGTLALSRSAEAARGVSEPGQAPHVVGKPGALEALSLALRH